MLLQPLFRREAVWLEFKRTAWADETKGPGVKISVGGQYVTVYVLQLN